MENDNDRTESFITLTKGTKVGHYTILSKIGAGGMGEVYLAEDTKLKRQVALKFLPMQYIKNDDLRERFTREARAVATLSHPNIVTIFEVSDFNNRPFFAMEHIPGLPLRDVIKKGKLNTSELIDYSMQICEGLHKAHESGIVHRDIKPANIIIDNDGRTKILDFGLAMMAGEDKLTQTGSTLGTVGYMSPEQITGTNVDHRSDIFSVGVILYEMLTGRKPFAGDNDAAIVKAITDSSPEPVARFKSGMTGELQSIIDKALAKDVSLRYQHADGMLADLRRLASESAQIQKPIDKWNRYVVPSTLVVFLAIFVIWKFGFLEQTPTQETDKKIMLAVLPFENLGAPDDEYFADGLTEEITSRLGVVRKLGVISRTSTMLYKNSDKGLPQIADELGVDYIIEGTVRWDKTGDTSMVRITPQLIRVSDNTHLWANNYERPLTRIFSVQADIATSIVENLDITLLQPERDALTNEPTKNTEAYTYYLKAVAYTDDSEYELAEQMILKSISLDSTFAEAYAEYSYINSYQYFFAFADLNKKDNYSMLAKMYSQRAFEMNPESPYTLRALGFYSYYVEGDYDRALDYYERGLKLEPNNSKLLNSIATLNFRASLYNSAYKAQKEASIIDPGNSGYSYSLAHICLYLRKGEEAIKILNKALEFSPDNETLYFWKVMISSLYFGSPSMVKEAVNEAITNNVNFYNFYNYGESAFEYEYLTRDFDKIIKEVRKQGLQGARTYVDTTFIYFNILTTSYYFLNDTINLRIYADSVRQIIESLMNEVNMRSEEDSYNKEMLAEVYFYLGNKEKGLQLLNEVVDDRFIDRDGKNAPWGYMWKSVMYIKMGEHETGLDMIEYLLSRPSPLNVAYLKVSIYFDPLRDNPRFQALLKKYEK